MPSRAEATRLRALQRRKGREEQGLLLAEGPRLLEELERSGLPVGRILHTAAAAAADDELRARLGRYRERGVVVEELGERELAGFADTVTPQGVVATAVIPRPDWSPELAARVLVLDALQDPGNLGTLLRTAEALGLDGAVVLPGTVDPWSPKAVRAAAGASFRLPVVAAEREGLTGALRTAGVRLWVADAAGEPVGRAVAAPEPLALVLGNEGAGVSDALRRAADRAVAIAMEGRVESLNVAVAGAILMDRIFGGARARRG